MHDENNKQAISGERRASVTKIIMVKDRRASLNRLIQSTNQINLANTRFVKRENRQSSSLQGYYSDSSSNYTNITKRYSVTRILPVRSRISADDALYLLNNKRSISLDRAGYRQVYIGEASRTQRRFSVTKIIPICPKISDKKQIINFIRQQKDVQQRYQQQQQQKQNQQKQQVKEKPIMSERERSIDVVSPLLEMANSVELEKTTMSIQPDRKKETDMQQQIKKSSLVSITNQQSTLVEIGQQQIKPHEIQLKSQQIEPATEKQQTAEKNAYQQQQQPEIKSENDSKINQLKQQKPQETKEIEKVQQVNQMQSKQDKPDESAGITQQTKNFELNQLITEKKELSIQKQPEHVFLDKQEIKQNHAIDLAVREVAKLADVIEKDLDAIMNFIEKEKTEKKNEVETKIQQNQISKEECEYEKTGKKKHVSFDVQPEVVHEYKLFEDEIDEMEDTDENKETVSTLINKPIDLNFFKETINEEKSTQDEMEDNLLKALKEKSKWKKAPKKN